MPHRSTNINIIYIKSSYKTETHNETEKNYHYNYKKRRKKDIFSGQRIRISTLSLFHCYNNKQ